MFIFPPLCFNELDLIPNLIKCETMNCLKVAQYSFLKSGKHMFQTQNPVH